MKQLHSGKCVHVVKFFNIGPIFSIDYPLLVSGIYIYIYIYIHTNTHTHVCEENFWPTFITSTLFFLTIVYSSWYTKYLTKDVELDDLLLKP